MSIREEAVGLMVCSILFSLMIGIQFGAVLGFATLFLIPILIYLR